MTPRDENKDKTIEIAKDYSAPEGALMMCKKERFINEVRLILLMTEISITKMSSKGQIVIPREMREGIEEGDKMVIMKNNGQIILKKMEDFDKNLKEDLKFAKRTEEAWKEIDAGKGIKTNVRDFLKEMKSW